jgi:ABC-type transport system substrate-binding protein
VQFSDGTPFDAEAVKFGLDRNIESGNGGAFAVNEFETIDDALHGLQISEAWSDSVEKKNQRTNGKRNGC